MATSSKVHLSLSQPSVFRIPDIGLDTATVTSKLLQKTIGITTSSSTNPAFMYIIRFATENLADLEQNYITHHLLTLFALNSTPAELERAWNDNVSYQRPPVPVNSHVASQLHNQNVYETYLGCEEYCQTFLTYF
ncbi:HypA protein [Stagonosporopsis vannaccii]|nr:HypA protein [Stagonosporopsis vannaccii]